MNTIKTDIKRAILSLPFLASCVAVVLVIAMGAGGKVLFPKDVAQGLYPFYHMQLVLNALQSDIMLIVVPILCTIPYTSAFLDEYNSGYIKTYQYLLNAKPDMFSAFEKKLNGKTTSLVERVMRTVNLRINVGKWSTAGALNALKVRLAYYYNGFDVCDKNYDKILIQKI